MGEHYDIGGGRERYIADLRKREQRAVNDAIEQMVARSMKRSQTPNPKITLFQFKDKQMTTANEKQVGGKHYKSEYQHWDLVLDFGLHYLEGCATKYVTRRKGNRGEDIGKAIHYVEKLIEALEQKSFEIRGDGRFKSYGPDYLEARLKDYSLANGLTFREHVIMKMIVCHMEYAAALDQMKELQKEV